MDVSAFFVAIYMAFSTAPGRPVPLDAQRRLIQGQSWQT